jgi:Dolichyl-phosphate-mannose-protein mannosyltransferase
LSPRVFRASSILFLAAGGALALWLAGKGPGELRDTLEWLSPRSLELTFLLLVSGAVASFSAIRGSFPGRSLLLPLAVGLVAFVMVATIPRQTHRIYYDEDIYENVAQNILWVGRAQMCNEGTLEQGTFRCDNFEYNKEPNGFPVLLSLAFRFGGVREGTAHAMNHAVFALGAVAVFWIAAMLFDGAWAGAGAALVYILIPQNLLWGATVAAEPAAASFAALGLGAWILFCRKPAPSTAVFGSAGLAFACQFRPESGLILLPAALATLLMARGILRTRELWWAAVLTLVLLTPHFAHMAAVRGERWGSGDGDKFSLSAAKDNWRPNVDYLTKGEDFPTLFTALALLGLCDWRRYRGGATTLVWFLAFFGIFIPFYAGSYRYGADVRFSLVSAAPLAVLAGAGLAWLSTRLHRMRPERLSLRFAPYAVAIYAFTPYLPLTRAVGRESWASRADHAAALRMVAEIPEDAIVLTHNPGMLQVMGRSAAQVSIATTEPQMVDAYFHRFAGGVYFHYNFWCNVPDPLQNEFCTNMLARYGTRVVMEESTGFYRYVLYRLLPKSAPPEPPTPPLARSQP